MKLSVGTDNVNFHPVDIKSREEVIETLTSKNWSPSLYKDNYRKLENFEYAEVIALDIDEGMSIDEAMELFKEYKHAILPTQNHRKEKRLQSGKVKPAEDRFRVLLFLSEPITDIDTFYATWYKLAEKFPAVDPQAKDPSRLFYPSIDCVSISSKGKTIDPVVPEKSELDIVLNEDSETVKGDLSKRTLRFIAMGAPDGEWNGNLFKAAVDCFEQGYSEEETVELLKPATRKELGNSGKFDKNDMRTIKSAFNRDPKYDPRIKKKAFNFLSAKDILNSKEKTEWLVENLLARGGMSIIAGDPKAGKSTIIRQLSRSVALGEPWLDRSVKKGSVYYLALEEQKEQIRDHIKLLGVPSDADIKFHIGTPHSLSELEDLTEILEGNEVDLLVVDTMIMLMPSMNLNDYQEVYSKLKPYANLARKTGTHILLVHHTNKSGMGTRSIAGSRALHGIVDCAMVFEIKGKKRIFNTSQRGGKTFYNRELIYSEETESYTLGPEWDEFDSDF